MTQDIAKWEALAATGSELANTVAPLDAARMATLRPADRQAQLDARNIVYKYYGDLWHSHKREQLDPHANLQWAAAGALYDMFGELSSSAYRVVNGLGSESDAS